MGTLFGASVGTTSNCGPCNIVMSSKKKKCASLDLTEKDLMLQNTSNKVGQFFSFFCVCLSFGLHARMRLVFELRVFTLNFSFVSNHWMNFLSPWFLGICRKLPLTMYPCLAVRGCTVRGICRKLPQTVLLIVKTWVLFADASNRAAVWSSCHRCPRLQMVNRWGGNCCFREYTEWGSFLKRNVLPRVWWQEWKRLAVACKEKQLDLLCVQQSKGQ